jgi:hypothetical protein
MSHYGMYSPAASRKKAVSDRLRPSPPSSQALSRTLRSAHRHRPSKTSGS